LEWVLSTLDRFLAAIFVAVLAVAASQVEPFTTQYSTRTAAQLTEAQAHLKDVQSGVRYQTMAPNVRQELEAEAKMTLSTRSSTHAAIANTLPVLKPYALWRHGDADIISETKRLFVPALPLTTASALNVLIGAIIGFVLYELVKLPVSVILRAPQRRRFKKR
jgi:hypothetical protein